MPPPVPIEDRVDPLNVDCLRHAPAEPVGLLMKYGDIGLGEVMIIELHMVSNGRSVPVVFSSSFLDYTFSLTHIFGFTICTVNLVDNPSFVQFFNLVLGVHQFAADSIVWLDMYPHICLRYF